MARHPNFYVGTGLDRVASRRKDADWVATLLVDPATRVVPVWRAKHLFARNGEESAPEPLYLSPETHAEVIAGAAETVLLGLAGETAYVAVDLSNMERPETHPVLAGRGEFVDLRAVGPLLPRETGATLAYARAVTTWHRNHVFCGRCGTRTESAEAGHVRRCLNPACGALHFPRTDPAVIMLVTRGERCLLGRQAVWPPGMYSTLAGFVEPGETLEEAVAREVFEETGIAVADVRYHSSQPWPFPSSLMLGFQARAETEEIRRTDEELEDARWFDRDFVAAHGADDGFRLPRTDSIARRLIEDWLAGEAGI